MKSLDISFFCVCYRFIVIFFFWENFYLDNLNFWPGYFEFGVNSPGSGFTLKFTEGCRESKITTGGIKEYE